ncbi:MAG: hypothetical protein M3T96_03835 [Acidobacteriota bacterium]|nr:hypothetical protein [Acidobacteriota bacterium]
MMTGEKLEITLIIFSGNFKAKLLRFYRQKDVQKNFSLNIPKVGEEN